MYAEFFSAQNSQPCNFVYRLDFCLRIPRQEHALYTAEYFWIPGINCEVKISSFFERNLKYTTRILLSYYLYCSGHYEGKKNNMPSIDQANRFNFYLAGFDIDHNMSIYWDHYKFFSYSFSPPFFSLSFFSL